MAAPSQQDGNTVPTSNAAEQGSAYSGNPHVPNTAEQKLAESQARLGLFLADIDLKGCSVDRAGTAEHQKTRARRTDGIIAAVELLPSGGGSGAADGQANGKLPADLQGIGTQFND